MFNIHRRHTSRPRRQRGRPRGAGVRVFTRISLLLFVDRSTSTSAGGTVCRGAVRLSFGYYIFRSVGARLAVARVAGAVSGGGGVGVGGRAAPGPAGPRGCGGGPGLLVSSLVCPRGWGRGRAPAPRRAPAGPVARWLHHRIGVTAICITYGVNACGRSISKNCPVMTNTIYVSNNILVISRLYPWAPVNTTARLWPHIKTSSRQRLK